MLFSESEKKKYPSKEEYFANFPEPVEKLELESLPEQFEALFVLEKVLRRIERIESNFFRSASFEEAENTVLSGELKEAYIQKRAAELKEKFNQTESTLRKSVYALLQSPEIRQQFGELFGENESLSTLEEIKQKARELLKGFYTLYEKKLRAEREKRDNLTQEQDIELKKEIVWDVTALSVPNDEGRSSKTEEWDQKRLKLFYSRRKEWDNLIEKLRFLPGVHQNALEAYLKAANSETALALINVYNQLEDVHRSGNFRNLEFSYTAFDAVDFESDLHEINKLLEEYQAQGLLPEQLSRETQEVITAEKAREILGREYFVGKEELQKIFDLSSQQVAELPDIPFTEAELRKAKEQEHTLVLRMTKDGQGRDLTGSRLNDIFLPKFPQRNKLLSNTDWYERQDFFIHEAPKTEWKLISADCILDSFGQNFSTQTKTLRDVLKVQGKLTLEEEQECSDERLNELAILERSDWRQAAEELTNLKVNQNHRPSFVECLYDAAVIFFAGDDTNSRRRVLENRFTVTRSRASSGRLVSFGFFFPCGATVDQWAPNNLYDYLVGVSLSC